MSAEPLPLKRVLLIVGGGIAAYKSLEVVRLLQRRNIAVTPVLTAGGREFVTPLSLQTLAGESVRENLFSLTDESAIGHISLAREADLVLVCPASANMIARMRTGMADDLATTLLLATTTPVVIAPAMNWRMWEHDATQENLAILQNRGVRVIMPEDGPMACGESGTGRLAEPQTIVDHILSALQPQKPLAGRRALVTAGPTHEPIDPVRVIANRSSGRQGFAIAAAFAELGAEVILVSGPVALPTPPGVQRVNVETAEEMLAACLATPPLDIVACAAAVADWRLSSPAQHKLKKKTGNAPNLTFVENPDILATLAKPGPHRPSLVIGFAAETEDLEANAIAKKARKGADWIVANDVGKGSSVFGGNNNTVMLISEAGVEKWREMSKGGVARTLAERVASQFRSTE